MFRKISECGLFKMGGYFSKNSEILFNFQRDFRKTNDLTNTELKNLISFNSSENFDLEVYNDKLPTVFYEQLSILKNEIENNNFDSLRISQVKIMSIASVDNVKISNGFLLITSEEDHEVIYRKINKRLGNHNINTVITSYH